jgi:diguanylate cyclase (GGDEF)-like protein
MARAERNQKSLVLAMVDIDHFKRVNDTHGHNAGYLVLRGVSDALSGSMRATDLVARWGGEEFAVLLTDIGLTAAMKAAERWRCAVERVSIIVGAGKAVSVTVSIGLAVLPAAGDPDTALANADGALYAAKAAGRNCLMAA